MTAHAQQSGPREMPRRRHGRLSGQAHPPGGRARRHRTLGAAIHRSPPPGLRTAGRRHRRRSCTPARRRRTAGGNDPADGFDRRQSGQHARTGRYVFTSRPTQQFKQIEDAVRANKSDDVGHVAHSCKGASATLGMTRLAAVLLKLEKAGQVGRVDRGRKICAEARARIQGHPDIFSRSMPALAVTPPK